MSDIDLVRIGPEDAVELISMWVAPSHRGTGLADLPRERPLSHGVRAGG